MTISNHHFGIGLPTLASRSHLRHLVGVAAALVDAAAVFVTAASVSAVYHRVAYQPGVDTARIELAVMLTALFVFVNLIRGRYVLANHLSPERQLSAAATAWNITMIAFIAILFLLRIAETYSRAVVFVTYLAGVPVIALARLMLVRAVAMGSKTGRITAERIFLIGAEPQVMSFVSRHQPWNLGLSLADVAFLKGEAAGSAQLKTDLTAAAARCRQLQADAVFIAVPWSDQETIDACVEAFMNLPVAIHLAPERIMDRFENPHIVRVGSLASLRLTRPALSTFEIAVKRAFDAVAASMILLLTMPVLVLIGLAVRLDSPGPILFMQRRHGFNQRTFRIVKFRTMTVTEDGDVVRQATKNDRRITRVGAILRRFNLDELPQLLNVIAGQMSLVGPRPHALAHDHEFERKIARYARRHNVKPGITGWAQVNGYRGETDTDEKMAKRVELDHWYIDNWSFWLDIVILIRTVVSQKAYRNAY